MVGRVTLAFVVVLGVAGCSGRPLPLRDVDVGPGQGPGVPDPDPNPPLGLSADFGVDLRVDGEMETVNVSALFWTGDVRPQPGGGGGPSLRLDHEAGESITVNGVEIAGGVADWGYLYLAHSVPEPADGRWLFRLTFQGRTVEVELLAPRSRYVDFPAGPVSVDRGVTLRWAPPLPANSQRQAYLTSCSIGDISKEVGLDSATFRGQLAVTPCMSHAQIIASFQEPLGEPFAGGNARASVWMDRALLLVAR
jgi:hypothetical protein